MKMSEDSAKQKVVVVGAGPVGALAALYAATRGDRVVVYELRGDLRDPHTTSLNFTKTINLALSERGINSIRNARCRGLLDEILKETIPMRGRMIHGQKKDGKLVQESQAYDPHGRCIQAADRAALNKSLLDALETMPNVRLCFNHKLTGANFDSKTAWFEQQKGALTDNNRQNQTRNGPGKMDQDRLAEISVDFDLLIGADGAHSAARYHMMKYARVNYQQEYIDTLWCEFRIDPKQPGSSFAISPNHLHIWPGGSSMFIAIPSCDKSFTCTLFASSSDFAWLSACPMEDLLSYFIHCFPGVCPELISTKDLQEQFRENPHLPLISIKCSPYHYKSSVVILGDAAHAMVPFYGQGMNSGLEDVRILFEFLDQYGVYGSILHGPDAHESLRAKALQDYTTQRAPDAATINELAVRNYEEMRSDVQSPLYRMRKLIEEKVDLYLPRLGWKTQYSRVSFENERFTEVKKAVLMQGMILMNIFGWGVLGLGGLVGIGLWRSGFAGRMASSFSRQRK